jgi:hypothetical protein
MKGIVDVIRLWMEVNLPTRFSPPLLGTLDLIWVMNLNIANASKLNMGVSCILHNDSIPDIHKQLKY